MNNISRRNFIKTGTTGAIAFGFSNSWAGAIIQNNFNDSPDIIIELTAITDNIAIKNSSLKTPVWRYIGKLIKGPKSSLTVIKNSYLGPTLNVFTGDKVKIIFKNMLPEKSITHWHGLDVSHENDGHPHFAKESGESYEYNFVVNNRAGMYWYHPHPHGRTGYQVYKGLAGLFVVRDHEERRLELPSGNQEKLIVLQDRKFKANGELDYRPNMMGAHGDTLLINGRILNSPIPVSRGSQRIRILNGCNARIFNLARKDRDSFTQIGSDGGLLRSAHQLGNFFFSPAERIDLLIDFSDKEVGEIVTIESRPLLSGRGENFTVLQFIVTEEETLKYKTPNKISYFKTIKESEAVNINKPKTFELIPKRGTGWTINGKGYEHNKFEDYERIRFGDTEIWEFYNPTGMPHPIHIHGTQFQVLSRESGKLKGALDEGFKDVVLVLPKDRVRVIKRFNTFKGVFIYHCHNLEHEDMSMMRNFIIE